MNIFTEAQGFERVVYAQDDRAGLKAIIAIHSTRLGPALGGTRCRAYESTDDALSDVLRLAEGMTYKAAASGLDLGGGKAVIIADPERDKTEALLRAYGRAVDSLDGRYITSVDVGTTVADLDEMHLETDHVVGRSPHSGGCGDPSPYTALGVASAMKAALYQVTKKASLRGTKIAIQGVGKVGHALAGICVEAGAEVVVGDVSVDAVGRAVADFGVGTAELDEVLFVDADIVAPCALGGVINLETIDKLSCQIVCGAANNQLADISNADALVKRGILYAPDFIVNAGGLICVADELQGFSAERVSARVEQIGRRLQEIFALSVETGENPTTAAVDYAKRRIEIISSLVY